MAAAYFRRAKDYVMKDPGYVLLHLGTATGLVGFSMSDPLPLRLCSVASSLSSITYVLTRPTVPSLAPVYWGCCFLTINTYKILQLWNERQYIEMNDTEEEIYVKHFMKSGMRPKQFKRLINAAKKREFEDGQILHREGAKMPPNVMLLIRGVVKIMTNNEILFTVDADKPACFLGDTHLLEASDKAEGSNASIPTFNSTAIATCQKGKTVVALEWDNVSTYNYQNM
jgi:hypothetical protein